MPVQSLARSLAQSSAPAWNASWVALGVISEVIFWVASEAVLGMTQ
jgi:hypothetical protein